MTWDVPRGWAGGCTRATVPAIAYARVRVGACDRACTGSCNSPHARGGGARVRVCACVHRPRGCAREPCAWLGVVARGWAWLRVVARGCAWLRVVARGRARSRVVARGCA
eukprot:6214340-Pleurochrysis_carterae.AAC.1